MKERTGRGGGDDVFDDLWRFCLAFYEQPGVAAALLALQDRCGLDVNLVLFALWHGLSGRGCLDAAALAGADRAIAAPREQAVRPLRALRRRLKGEPAADVQQLRERIKEVEIEAERLVLRRLARLAAAPEAARAGLADALSNLDGYAGAQPEAAVIGRALAEFAALAR